MKHILPLINFKAISVESFLKEVVPTNLFSATEVLENLRLQFRESSPILHMLSCTRLQNHNILMKKNCKVQFIDIVSKPSCNFSFFYHFRNEPHSEKIIVLESNDKVFLKSVKAEKTCFVGNWTLEIFDFRNHLIASSSVRGDAHWTFDKLVPIYAGKIYTIRLNGKGTMTKHKTIQYNSTLNGVAFTGIALSCSFKLEYWTSVDEFVP